MLHDLKCWPAPFQAVKAGLKPYEIRDDDRHFEVGDHLLLREWDPEDADPDCPMHDQANRPVIVPRGYTGSKLLCEVTYKTPGGAWGLPARLCVLGIAVQDPEAPLWRVQVEALESMVERHCFRLTPEECVRAQASGSLAVLAAHLGGWVLPIDGGWEFVSRKQAAEREAICGRIWLTRQERVDAAVPR